MAGRSHFAAPLLLAVFVGLIAYVSLFPFRFDPQGPTMVEAVRLLDWGRASRLEMFNNVLLYLPFGFCCALAVEPRFGRRAGLAAAIVCGAALSLGMELLQASIPTRVTSLKDLTLNTVGAAIGAVCGSAWHVLGARMTPQANPRGRAGAVALTIVVLWLVTRLWPLVPDPGLRQLKRAVRPLLTPSIDFADLVAFLLGWLVVAQAMFHLTKRQRAVDLFLIVIACVLVGRTFIAGNTLVTAEVAAIALLLPVLVLLNRLEDGARSALVAVLLGGWLASVAVHPMLHGASAFTTELPSFADFIARNPPQPQHLADKGFSYVALAWLLAGAGLVPHVASGLTFLFVLLLVLLQLGASAPVYGWVDVLVAAGAAFVVSRWMPSTQPSPARRK
jgi:glycopeptide antibiotics resistance protein